MITYNPVGVYQIFERSHFSNEIGAGISLCPNASRVLKQWGYEFVRTRGVIAEQASLSSLRTMRIELTQLIQGRAFDSNSLDVIYFAKYDYMVPKYGAP